MLEKPVLAHDSREWREAAENKQLLLQPTSGVKRNAAELPEEGLPSRHPQRLTGAVRRRSGTPEVSRSEPTRIERNG